MNESPRCPKCGIQLPADAPAGLCPKCLVQAGFESQPVAASAEPGPTKLTPPASGFVPPTVEELAPLFPQLEILELLGKGGMGAVYKARQPGLDRLVAVKILPPEISHDPAFTERFQREARALARLSHPHIVAVYDFGQVALECGGLTPPSIQLETTSGAADDDPKDHANAPLMEGGVKPPHSRDALCYIVMEFVDGANLRQAMRTGTLTSAEALVIVPQICEALQFAHDEGIVHRDIKPENILIDKRGRVKIADFGLAKLLGQDASDHSLTATNQVMGTLRYMAPEQMQGSREVDHRADIYSLGVVFYELLTGELPMGKFAPPSKRVQVDVRLDEIVLRALEQDPEQRYQHASEVKTDVEVVASGKDETARRNRAHGPADAVFPRWLLFSPFDFLRGQYQKTGTGPVSLPHLVQSPADCLLLAAGIAFVTACGVAVWLRAVPAYSSNQFTNSMIRGNLIGMSVGLAIYSVLVGVAGLMLRRLRARLVVLLVAVIVGLFFPAVIALNVVMELRNIPVWPVVVPLWLGMPAALWVVVRLFRDDVRGAFDAAAEQRAEKTGTEKSSGEPGGVSPRTGGEQVRGLTPSGSPIQRPKLVPVLATFNLLGAIVLMLLCAMEEQAAFTQPVPRLWQVWGQVDAVLGFVTSAGLFAASIGLYLWKPWARKLTLGVCSFALASLVFDAPYLARFALPDLYADLHHALIGEFDDPDLHDFAALVAVVVLAGGPMLVGLTWLIGQLVYFTRPRVVAAFGREAENGGVAGGWQTRPQPQPENPPNGIGRISLWSAIAGVVLPVLLAIGALLVAPSQRLSDFFVLCVVLGGLLELVALGCGIVARRTGSGKVGLFIACASLVVGLLFAAMTPVHFEASDPGPVETVLRAPDAVPRLGTITSGIGAEFIVPAGQVAVFEIVTRRNNATVPVPPHCGYVMAPPDSPVAGTFRWSRMPEEIVAGGRGRKWSLEILSGSGRGYTEGLLLPDELNAAVGARGLGLGLLEPNEEAVHWGTADANDLPANGLIGLRVTVVAHGMKAGGSGNAHIDWKKVQSAQSTTRRKLPIDAP